VGVLISALAPTDLITLTGQPCDRVRTPGVVLLVSVYFYDQQGVETLFLRPRKPPNVAIQHTAWPNVGGFLGRAVDGTTQSRPLIVLQGRFAGNL